MNIFGFQTVDGLPCLYYPDTDLLVLSDLHLGLEGTMTSKGNYVPKHQLNNVMDDLEDARKITGADRVIINGDLKNNFKTSYSENREVQEFLDFLRQEFEEVVLIRGNHDTFLERTLNKKDLEMKDYHVESSILFVHGDKSMEDLGVEEFDTLVIGHEHPALALKDAVGVKEKIDCFLYGKTKNKNNIIVLPAFSQISRGININETPNSQLLSPILKNQTNKDELKAVGVSKNAGIFKFPEIGKL